MTKHLVTFVEKREIVIREDDSVLCHEDCPAFITCDWGRVECEYFGKTLQQEKFQNQEVTIKRCGACILATGSGAWDCGNNNPT